MIDYARKKLIDGEYTCFVCVNGKEYSSKQRGVRPLIDFLQSGESFSGGFAADKTIGAGAAHLYALLKVQAVWAKVISQSALQILKENGISVSYEELVPHIINRQGNGICPIEQTVYEMKSSAEAYEKILERLKSL